MPKVLSIIPLSHPAIFSEPTNGIISSSDSDTGRHSPSHWERLVNTAVDKSERQDPAHAAPAKAIQQIADNINAQPGKSVIIMTGENETEEVAPKPTPPGPTEVETVSPEGNGQLEQTGVSGNTGNIPIKDDKDHYKAYIADCRHCASIIICSCFT